MKSELPTVRLNAENLKTVASRGAIVPLYNRNNLKPKVVHMSLGAFHRSHQALYFDDLAKAGNSNWGVVSVGLLPADKANVEAMKKQDSLYSIIEREGEEVSVRVIGSIIDVKYAPEQTKEVLDLISSPTTELVTLTLTEGGYYSDPSTGQLEINHPDIQKDLANLNQPTTGLGYLISGLKMRYESGVKPLTVLCCDNIQGNGTHTKNVVLAFAGAIEGKFADWINSKISFPNSMVDRITPRVTEQDKKWLYENIGLEDQWPVTCESFCQWIVEDKFSGERPNLDQVGVQFVKDVHPYEMMKIRLLNAGHSLLGYLGYLSGFRFIDEIARDSDFQKLLFSFMDNEASKTLMPVPGINLSEYKKQLVKRFSNAAIKDQALRICMDGSAKIPKFLLPTVRDLIGNKNSFKIAALIVAAWIRFVNGVDEQGKKIPLEDPQAKLLASLSKEAGKSALPFLQRAEIFGEDLSSNSEFTTEVQNALDVIYAKGARVAVQSYF